MKTDTAVLRTFVPSSFHMLFWKVLHFEQQGSILSGDKEFLTRPLRPDPTYSEFTLCIASIMQYATLHHITSPSSVAQEC
jgi:hypothetical protein